VGYYKLGKLWEPDDYTEIPDDISYQPRDFFCQEIDYVPTTPITDKFDEMLHHGCIEIHGETAELVEKRARAVLFGLELLK